MLSILNWEDSTGNWPRQLWEEQKWKCYINAEINNETVGLGEACGWKET